MFHTPNSFWRQVARPFATAAIVLGLALPSSAGAQELPTASPPVFVTSLGQSLDGYQIQLATKRAKADVTYDPLAGVDQLEGAKTLFLAVGASLKGFGEAGISIDDERERAREFIAEAEAREIPIIVLHMGGAERRDDLTNQLIEVTAPHADAIFIRNDSDADGVFKRIAEEGGIPLVSVETIVQLVPELQRLLGTTS